jgi:hypothetical protein
MSIARIFQRPAYQSEATSFIEALKRNKPTLEAEQRAGRALLWDKQLNQQDMADWNEARVPQKPYPYQTNPS